MMAALRVLFLCGVIAFLVSSAASAQSWPNRPIRMLAPVNGGLADIAGRLIAQGIAEPLRQQVIVDNRPGIVAIESAIKAVPDGYTILVFSQSMWIGPLLSSTTTYDPIADLTPVTPVASTPNVLVVHPSMPVKSVRDLIALAKNRPGEMNYASGPTGGTPHLAMELFMSMTGIRFTRIPYKGSAQALTDLMAGNVQVMFPPAASVTSFVTSGRLKALAVTSVQPSALAPGLPTVAASVPGYESVSNIGMFAPLGTPAAIVSRLNQEIVRVLNAPDAKDKLLKGGAEAIPGSPPQLTAMMQSEISRMGKVIRERGIRE
jgi:tripartite-type tricarboxylate transporter receptor subunit TctC